MTQGYQDRLQYARKLLADKGREALDNPHAMIGRTCGCGTCFTCAAAQVIREFDALNRVDDRHLLDGVPEGWRSVQS